MQLLLCLCRGKLAGGYFGVTPGLVPMHPKIAHGVCRYGPFDDYDEEEHILFQQNQGVGKKLSHF